MPLSDVEALRAYVGALNDFISLAKKASATELSSISKCLDEMLRHGYSLPCVEETSAPFDPVTGLDANGQKWYRKRPFKRPKAK